MAAAAMAVHRIRVGDEVVVLAGRDRGKRGKVLRLLGARALVDNVNLVKKHVRPNPNKNETGGIIEKEAPVHLSNLSHYNPRTGRGGRIGVRTLEDGRKVRYFKSDGEVLDLAK